MAEQIVVNNRVILRDDVVDDMQDAVCKIVHGAQSDIEPGTIFDSHYVIVKLIERKDNVYARFCAFFSTVPLAHSAISKLVRSCKHCDRLVIDKTSRDSVSDNIRGNATRNAAWLRKDRMGRSPARCREVEPSMHQKTKG